MKMFFSTDVLLRLTWKIITGWSWPIIVYPNEHSHKSTLSAVFVSTVQRIPRHYQVILTKVS